MKLLFYGNTQNNTGPAIVNKSLKKNLPSKVFFINSTNQLFMSLELIIKIIIADVVVFSGLSKAIKLGAFIASIFNTRIIYIMHGSISYESRINKLKNNMNNIKREQKTWEIADLILCVSEPFLNWFTTNYPQFKEKSSYLNNGINWEALNSILYEFNEEKDPNAIISTGGGRPQKNNLSVAKAIQKINDSQNKSIIYYVLGDDGEDTEELKKIACVNYKGKLSYLETISYLNRSTLYIQNSTLDSFGLAPIEALLSGCDLLLSRNVGSISILSGIKENDIIKNVYDIEEIISKIQNVYKQKNNQYFLKNIDRKKTSYEFMANRLLDFSKELLR